MERRTKTNIRIAGLILFIIYLGTMIYFLFFAEEYGRRILTEEPQYNLVLFREIRRFWENREILGMKAVLLNILGNVAAFIPLGAILPVIAPFVRRHPRAVATIAAGFILSLLVELLQLVTKVGSFDVDDLLLNTLGAAAGYCLFALGRRCFHKTAAHRA